LEEITQQRIPNQALLNYELWALKKMSWKLNARTAAAFLTSYHELNLLRPYDLNSPVSSSTLLNAGLKLSTKVLLDMRFKPLQTSCVAAAIVYFLRQKYLLTPVWTEDLSAMTFHDALTSKMVVQAVRLLVDLEGWGDLSAWGMSDVTPAATAPSLSVELSSKDQNILSTCQSTSSISLTSPVKVSAAVREVLQELTTPVLMKGGGGGIAGEPEYSPVSIAALIDM
jgi:hypothetical protein